MAASANPFEWTEFEGGVARMLSVAQSFSVTVMQGGRKAHVRILTPSNPIMGERSEHPDPEAAMRFAEARVVVLGGLAGIVGKPRLQVVSRTN